jgi:SlyX protein
VHHFFSSSIIHSYYFISKLFLSSFSLLYLLENIHITVITEANMIEERLTALEIKFSHQDFLVDELNKLVSDQHQLIDKLFKEIQSLKISINGNAQSTRTLEDDVPPHY